MLRDGNIILRLPMKKGPLTQTKISSSVVDGPQAEGTRRTTTKGSVGPGLPPSPEDVVPVPSLYSVFAVTPLRDSLNPSQRYVGRFPTAEDPRADWRVVVPTPRGRPWNLGPEGLPNEIHRVPRG